MDADREVAAGQKLTEAKRAELAALQRGGVIEVNYPYYGKSVTVERLASKGKPLPKSVEGAKSVKLTGRASADHYSGEIQSQTGIPVIVQTKYTNLSGEQYVMPVSGLYNISYTGSMSKALGLLSSHVDAEWTFDGNKVVISRMNERSYPLTVPLGKTSFTSGSNSLATGSGGLTITRSGDLDPLSGVTARLDALITPPAEAYIDPTSSTLIVKGPPSVHTKVKAAVREIEDVYARKIGLEVAAYYVEADKVDDFASSLSRSVRGVSFTGLANAITGNGVATIKGNDHSFSFRAIASNDTVFDFQQISTTGQSGVWAELVTQDNTNYVSNSTTTTQDGVTTTSLQTDTIDGGLSVHALPRILDTNQISLQLNIVQKNLRGLDEFYSNGASVQLPKTDQRKIQSDVILQPGETLILAGYEHQRASSGGSGVGSPKAWFVGGSKKAEVKRVRLILMVRPTILSGG